MKSSAISIGKDSNYNEVAVMAHDNVISVSDGAGGGGLFADKWAQYLLAKLPTKPINSFISFDNWIDSIWENFYSSQERIAKNLAPIALNKFYTEGSFATLAAIWKIEETVYWISYGDSAIFCYDYDSHELFCSVNKLVEFNDAPHLISTNNPLIMDGFKYGTCSASSSKVFFCASDALSFYILASYYFHKGDKNNKQLMEVINSCSKNANIVRNIITNKSLDFENDILNKLQRASRNKHNFTLHMMRIFRAGLIAHDDYSICFMKM